jgi:ankyrin repeat protein/protein-tyrosine phosphatase
LKIRPAYERLDNSPPPPDNIPEPPSSSIVPLEEEQIEENIEDIRERLKSKLMEATMKEQYDNVENILSKRVDVNFLDSFGKTPLIYSLEMKNIQLTSLILSEPTVDINQTDANGQTPLIVLSKIPPSGSELEMNMIKILRKLILDSELLKVNAKDEGGNTALHYATANGDYTLAETLISRNGDVNMLNSTGFNPIHLAALQDNVKIILLFLKNGALLMIPTADGKLPADLTNDFQLKLTLFGSRTSHSHPLKISLIDLSFFAKKLGTLGISMCPGRRYKLWSRDILLDLETIVKANNQILVSVITRKELTEMGLNDFIECVRNIGLESYHISFSNGWVPNNTEEFKQLTTIIVLRLLEGKNVVVHCDSGKSRSALFVGSILCQLGMPPEKAKIMLRGMSEEYLSNPAQQIYLSGLKYKSLEISEKNMALTELESEISEKEETKSKKD